MAALPVVMAWEIPSSLIHGCIPAFHQSFQICKRTADGPLELNVVDGIILPNLKMARAEEACSFLDTNGRCTVHAFRPGICRMFPLGRLLLKIGLSSISYRYMNVQKQIVPK